MSDNEEVQPYSLFTLTELTGKKISENRRVQIATVEMSYPVAIGVVLGAIIGIVAMAMTWTMLGQWSILAGAVVGLAVGIMFAGRTRRGLEVRYWQRLWDYAETRRLRDEYILCGRLYRPGNEPAITVIHATVPVEPDNNAAADDLDVLAARSRSTQSSAPIRPRSALAEHRARSAQWAVAFANEIEQAHAEQMHLVKK